MASFRPLYDRVLVKRVESESRSTGGLFIPDTAKDKPQTAEVVAVGTGRLTDDHQLLALTVKKGDKVLFGKWSGTEVTIEGEELIIMKESDILGIVEKTAAAKK